MAGDSFGHMSINSTCQIDEIIGIDCYIHRWMKFDSYLNPYYYVLVLSSLDFVYMGDLFNKYTNTYIGFVQLSMIPHNGY